METKLKSVDNAITEYNFTNVKLAELKEKYLGLVVKAPTDMEGYLKCREAHQEAKKYLKDVEDKRKELNVDALTYTRGVNGRAKDIRISLEEGRDHLQIQRKVVEDEKKRLQEELERKEKEEQERLRKEEEGRFEAQRKEHEAKERELQEKEEALEKKKQEQEESGRILKEMAERQEREKKEAEEAKKRAEQAEKDRIEQEKRHAEEVKKAEAVAKEKAIKEEQERVERETKAKAEKEEAERVAIEKAKLMAPDKEKILAYAEALGCVIPPQTATEEAMGIVNSGREGVVAIVEFLTEEAKKL